MQDKSIEDRTCYYRFGIIDFLQDYSKKKKLETMYLRRRYKKKDPNCFSCVDPNTYGDRFYNFLVTNLFTQAREYPESELEGKSGRNNGGAASSSDEAGSPDKGTLMLEKNKKKRKCCL